MAHELAARITGRPASPSAAVCPKTAPIKQHTTPMLAQQWTNSGFGFSRDEYVLGGAAT